MTGKQLLGMTEDLERFLTGFDGLLGRPENRGNLRRFARGQLGTVERKSLEPMALGEHVAPRMLQEFFSQAKWDHAGVRDELQRRVSQEFGGPDGVFIVDETSDAKKGEMTAGVGRQYCGATGKIDNCIVTVHVAYTRGDFHTLLDGELFLPESWDADSPDPGMQAKRRKAAIPDGVGHVPKPAMALRMLARALRNGVPGRWVTADEGYGRDPAWRRKVAALGLNYIVEVPRNVMGWLGRPATGGQEASKEQEGSARRGRREAARKVEACKEAGEGWRTPWKCFRVHDTEKGPEVWEARVGSFREQGRNAPKEAQTLVVARNVRTKEVKYFLSNAPGDTPTRALLKVAFSRWRIERCFQDAKEELGMDHAEMRQYVGIHRLLILTCVNLFFLHRWLLTRGRGEKGSDRAATGQRDPETAGAPDGGPTDAQATAGLGGGVGGEDRADAAKQPALALFGCQEEAGPVTGFGHTGRAVAVL